MLAKEIVSTEDSERDSLNAEREAVSDGLGQTTNTPAVSTDCPPAVRRRLPDERRSLTHHFSVGGQEGYVTVGLYEDGLPGELFIRMAKEGSTVSGLMDSFATAVSLALQYGVPLLWQACHNKGNQKDRIMRSTAARSSRCRTPAACTFA